MGVGPTAGGHGLKGGAGGAPRGGNPVQYRASGAGAWGAAQSHAAAAAAAYPPYTRYPTPATQMPVGAQQLPPAANPYAATAYAQHASVRRVIYVFIFFFLIIICNFVQQNYYKYFGFFLYVSVWWTESTNSVVASKHKQQLEQCNWKSKWHD